MKKYQVILTDNPWTYNNKKTGGTHTSGAAQKYPVLTFDQLRRLPIQNIVHPDRCVLFMWVPVPLKDEGFRLIDAWKFKYKTTLYWRKTNINGMGYWFRGIMEELLVCTKGKVKAFRCQVSNIADEEVQKHSRKPDEFYKIIEYATAYKNIEDPQERKKHILKPKVELFATQKRKGWISTGFDVDGVDIRDFLVKKSVLINCFQN